MGVTDITELKGKVFDSDEINGVVFALEREGNTDETMEILGVTDNHLLIRWSGYCSVEYGILGGHIPFEAVFEAKYVYTADEGNDDDNADDMYGFVESDDSCEQTEELQAEFTPPMV